MVCAEPGRETKLFVLSYKGLISVLSGVEDEEGDAALEEQEALKLQRQMAEQLDDQDFGLDIFKVVVFLRLWNNATPSVTEDYLP